MPKAGNRTYSKGGQKLNGNAVKHGSYRADKTLIHDNRTKDAKYVAFIEANIISAIGGDPSPQQALLCRRVAFKALRCALVEAEMIRANSYYSSKDRRAQTSRQNGTVAQTLRDDYLRWSRELREDLKTLGLERRARNVQNLQQYISEKYGQGTEQP